MCVCVCVCVSMVLSVCGVCSTCVLWVCLWGRRARDVVGVCCAELVAVPMVDSLFAFCWHL